jgi:hypothetical protein
VTVVELVGASIGIPGLAENEDVVTLAEGVGEDGDRAEVDIGVVTGGLASGGTVEVPLGELLNGGNGLGEGLDGEETGDVSNDVLTIQAILLPQCLSISLSLSLSRDADGCRVLACGDRKK